MIHPEKAAFVVRRSNSIVPKVRHARRPGTVMDNTKGTGIDDGRKRMFKVTSFGTSNNQAAVSDPSQRQNSVRRIPVAIENNQGHPEFSGKNTENAGGTQDEEDAVYTISCKLPTQVREIRDGSFTPESRLTSEAQQPAKSPRSNIIRRPFTQPMEPSPMRPINADDVNYTVVPQLDINGTGRANQLGGEHRKVVLATSNRTKGK